MRKNDLRLFLIAALAFSFSVLSAWVATRGGANNIVLDMLQLLTVLAGAPGFIVGMIVGFVVGGFNVHNSNMTVIPIVAVIVNTWLYSWIFSKLKLREGWLLQKRH